MRIRAASSADAPALASVHLDTILIAYADLIPPDEPRPTNQSLVEEWESLFHDSTSKAFLAEENGQPVGTVAIRSDPDVADCGQLRRLYVVPDRWNHGVGSALHDRAVAALQNHGFQRVGLWVLEANAQARHFYERRGWTLVPEMTLEWPGLEVTEVRYCLDL